MCISSRTCSSKIPQSQHYFYMHTCGSIPARALTLIQISYLLPFEISWRTNRCSILLWCSSGSNRNNVHHRLRTKTRIRKRRADTAHADGMSWRGASNELARHNRGHEVTRPRRRRCPQVWWSRQFQTRAKKARADGFIYIYINCCLFLYRGSNLESRVKDKTGLDRPWWNGSSTVLWWQGTCLAKGVLNRIIRIHNKALARDMRSVNSFRY